LCTYQKYTLIDKRTSTKGEEQFKVCNRSWQSSSNFCSETHFTGLKKLFLSVRGLLVGVRYCCECDGSVLRCSVVDLRISSKNLESQLQEKEGDEDRDDCYDLLQIQRVEQVIENGSLTGSPTTKWLSRPRQVKQFMSFSTEARYASTDFSFFARIQRGATKLSDAILSVQNFCACIVSKVHQANDTHHGPENNRFLLTTYFELIAFLSVLQMLQENRKYSIRKVQDLTRQRIFFFGLD
jgi:hypothetical protein